MMATINTTAGIYTSIICINVDDTGINITANFNSTTTINNSNTENNDDGINLKFWVFAVGMGSISGIVALCYFAYTMRQIYLIIQGRELRYGLWIFCVLVFECAGGSTMYLIWKGLMWLSVVFLYLKWQEFSHKAITSLSMIEYVIEHCLNLQQKWFVDEIKMLVLPCF